MTFPPDNLDGIATFPFTFHVVCDIGLIQRAKILHDGAAALVKCELGEMLGASPRHR